jgi:hypothetical protein
VFQPVTYTGTGAATTITSSIQYSPDLVHIKYRSSTADNVWFDKLRGAGRPLITNTTAAQTTQPDGYEVYGWLNNGYNLGPNNANPVNNFGANFITYMFDRAPGFFDEVCYTGTGSATTVAHNLAAVPELMIFKTRSASFGWAVSVPSLGTNRSLQLQSTLAAYSTELYTTAQSATTVTLTNESKCNASGDTFVAYLFATCPGVSKVGSYTGTGTTLQINCGFTGGARFVLIKRTDSTGDWYVWDSARGIVSGNDPYLLLNSTAAEVTGTDYVDTFSSGFEISSTAPSAINANGGTYIFLAIA